VPETVSGGRCLGRPLALEEGAITRVARAKVLGVDVPDDDTRHAGDSGDFGNLSAGLTRLT
jgi:hypothetical protein